MSLDYPNREDWLAVRDSRALKHRPPKVLHVSGFGRKCRRAYPGAPWAMSYVGTYVKRKAHEI